MRIIEDCAPFAERHRGKNVTSGPHWSLIIRFVGLYDYARRLEEALKNAEEILLIWECEGTLGEGGEELAKIVRDALKGEK